MTVLRAAAAVVMVLTLGLAGCTEDEPAPDIERALLEDGVAESRRQAEAFWDRASAADREAVCEQLSTGPGRLTMQEAVEAEDAWLLDPHHYVRVLQEACGQDPYAMD